jgi:two-component system, NarL family, invasion response regulator UvrY
MTRILIVDDHPVVRKGIKDILLEEFPFAHIEEAADAEELIRKMMKGEWDLVISDLSLPGRSGLEMVGLITKQYEKLPVLILSMHPEEQYATRILKAGAAGYLNKEAAPEELTKAVKWVLQGRKYITPSIAEKLAEDLLHDNNKHPHELLSDREFDVFKLLAAGKPLNEIAEMLFLGNTTISTYRSRILSKMNLKSNADLTAYAIRNKLI